MTPQQVRDAFRKYDAALEGLGRDSIPWDTSEVLIVPPGAALNYGLRHARWMCQEALKFLPDPYCACGAPSCDLCHPPAREVPADMEKAMRWLGFVQGVLWATGTYSIGEMKDDNRIPKVAAG